MSLKEISDSLLKTRDVITKKPTKELETDLIKIRTWKDSAMDRLEKTVWSDLSQFIEAELKKREEVKTDV